MNLKELRKCFLFGFVGNFILGAVAISSFSSYGVIWFWVIVALVTLFWIAIIWGFDWGMEKRR